MKRIGPWAAIALLAVNACGFGNSAGQPSQSPSASSAQSVIPAEDLRAAAMNDPSLMAALQVQGKYGDHTITLLGAYADPVRIVLVFRVQPNDVDAGAPISISDDNGPISSSGGGGTIRETGDAYQGLDAGSSVPPGQVAHLKAEFHLQLPSGNPASPPKLTLGFALTVKSVDHLPAGAPFQLSSWKVTIQHLDVTPAFINLEAMFGGATIDDLMGQTHLDLVTAVDSSGNQLRPVAGGAGLASGGTVIHFQWMRPAGTGAYQVRFKANGAAHSIEVNVRA